MQCLSGSGLTLYSRGKSSGACGVLKKSVVEPRQYRDAMSRFAGAVHVVTTDGAAGRRGTTVIAACSVSDNPPTILVCLNRGNAANDRFVQNGVFALNSLSASHQDLANGFSGLTGLEQEQRPQFGREAFLAHLVSLSYASAR